MKNVSTFLNRNTKPTDWSKNEYRPAVGVNDAMRKQFFTNFNEDLLREIRRIKLNENK